MVLIADSGATKTDWVVLDTGTGHRQIATQGIHPLFQTEDDMARIVANELLPALGAGPVDELHFYGAGCLPHTLPTVERALRRHLTVTGTVEVCSDLLAAARALCGRQPGIACILGTGSNSCYYDGRSITAHVPPLGFILGDEGSGACLGKRLVGDALKGLLPAGLKEALLQHLGMTEADIIDRVYRQPLPNRFLASLAPFLAAHLDVPAVRTPVKEAFTAFLQRNVMQYDYRRYPVHFAGSIAHHFSPILHEAAHEAGITIGTVTPTPLAGLMAYHQAGNSEGYPKPHSEGYPKPNSEGCPKPNSKGWPNE